MEIAGSPTLGKELHSAAIAAAASANLRRGLTGRVSFISRRSGGCFADDGHLRYYGSPVRCGARKEEKMMMKRREKLVEGLVGLRAAGGLNLNALAGCEVDDGQVAVDVRIEISRFYHRLLTFFRLFGYLLYFWNLLSRF